MVTDLGLAPSTPGYEPGEFTTTPVCNIVLFRNLVHPLCLAQEWMRARS